MKKVLIVNNNMHIGGVQKALISLLWNIHERYDVTLLLFSKAGDCYGEIPPGVKVVTVKSAYRFLGMTGRDAYNFWDKLGRAFFAAITRVFGRRYAIALMGLGQRKVRGYDIAISYLHNAGSKVFYGGCNDFVLKHVQANKKIAFLHCDYLLSGANSPENNKMYAEFNGIAACSQGCADSFCKVNPSLEDKVKVVPNCHRFDRIRELAQIGHVDMSRDTVNIVTVARLGKEKGVERAVRAIARLGETQSKLHYYIIGDGVQMQLIQRIISENHLTDCVTLCGMISNPYGYIQSADLLLIPSYSEAAPLVIGESVCLGTPILSTETSSAREMIEERGYGWVCENTEGALFEALEKILNNHNVLLNVQNKMDNETISNTNALVAFDFLIN